MALLTITDDIAVFAAMGSWVQALISLVGLILLLWTFKLQADTFLAQQKVTKAQIDLLEIEQHRYRKETLPELGLDEIRPITFGWTPDTPPLKLKVTVIKGPILRMKINIGSCSDGIKPITTFPLDLNLLVTNYKEELHFDVSKRESGANDKITIEVEFADINANVYEQTMAYLFEKGGKCLSGDPILKKTVEK